VGDLGPEALGDDLDRGERVLDDVVQQAGRDRHHVQLEVGEEIGDLERVDHVRFARVPHLPLVFEGREDVRAPEQLEVGLRAIATDLLDDVLEANHGPRCLNPVCR
jgi:hypothetical protein